MAFNILGLLTPEIVQLCQEEPVMADLNGGLQFIDNLKDFTSKLRTDLLETADIRRAVSIESAIEQKLSMVTMSMQTIQRLWLNLDPT